MQALAAVTIAPIPMQLIDLVAQLLDVARQVLAQLAQTLDAVGSLDLIEARLSEL